MPEIDLPTVIFALVALFVAWKLRSVLGMRQDSERPGSLCPLRRTPARPARLSRSRTPRLRRLFTGPRGTLERRRRARSRRLERARRHFGGRSQLLAEAFLAGARAPMTWSSMPSPPAIPTPSKALCRPRPSPISRARSTPAPTPDTQCRPRSSRSTTPRLSALGSSARPRNFRVRFSAKLASVTRDTQGEVVDGSPDTVVEHIDLWTFARDVRSRDPNWQLTATKSER